MLSMDNEITKRDAEIRMYFSGEDQKLDVSPEAVLTKFMYAQQEEIRRKAREINNLKNDLEYRKNEVAHWQTQYDVLREIAEDQENQIRKYKNNYNPHLANIVEGIPSDLSITIRYTNTILEARCIIVSVVRKIAVILGISEPVIQWPERG